MFEVVDEEVERRHQSQEDVAEVKKKFSFNKSKYKIGEWFKHQDHFLGGLIVAIVDWAWKIWQKKNFAKDLNFSSLFSCCSFASGQLNRRVRYMLERDQ